MSKSAISRRHALAAGAAMVATSTVPAMAASDPDAEIIASGLGHKPRLSRAGAEREPRPPATLGRKPPTTSFTGWPLWAWATLDSGCWLLIFIAWRIRSLDRQDADASMETARGGG